MGAAHKPTGVDRWAFNGARSWPRVEPVSFEVDGTAVRGEHYAPEGPARGGLILLHGLNSCVAEFGDLPARLAAAGYHAMAFDQRGFGASSGERGLTSVARAVADAEAARAWLATRVQAPIAGKGPRVGKAKGTGAPSLPIGLLGHSLGGAYAVAALAKGSFAFGVLAHPVDRLWELMSPLERAAYHVLGRLNERRQRRGRPSRSVPYRVHYSQIFVSREAAQAAQRPPFLLHRANLGNYRMALEAKARDEAVQVKVPVLTVWSHQDRVVRWAASKALHEQLGGPKETFEHAGGHSCFRDLDGARVAAGIVAWLDRTVPTRASDAGVRA